MDRRLKYVVVGVAVVVVLVAAFAVGRMTSGDGDQQESAAVGTTTTSVATTTILPVPSSTPAATTASTAAPVGKALTGAGAMLEVAPAPTVQSTEGPNVACQALADPGWTATCARVDMAGGTRVWLTESRPAGAFKAWRALVLHFSQGRGAWLTDLRYADDGTAPSLTDIKVVTSDLTADGKPELVFGFRRSGTGSILVYDIVVDSAGGAPKVSATRGLSHGSASVRGGTITDYEAKYPNNEPNCCPGYIQESTVSYSGGGFRVVEGRQQPPATATGGTDL